MAQLVDPFLDLKVVIGLLVLFLRVQLVVISTIITLVKILISPILFFVGSKLFMSVLDLEVVTGVSI
jgi:hypothetical protein